MHKFCQNKTSAKFSRKYSDIYGRFIHSNVLKVSRCTKVYVLWVFSLYMGLITMNNVFELNILLLLFDNCGFVLKSFKCNLELDLEGFQSFSTWHSFHLLMVFFHTLKNFVQQTFAGKSFQFLMLMLCF